MFLILSSSAQLQYLESMVSRLIYHKPIRALELHYPMIQFFKKRRDARAERLLCAYKQLFFSDVVVGVVVNVAVAQAP